MFEQKAGGYEKVGSCGALFVLCALLIKARLTGSLNNRVRKRAKKIIKVVHGKSSLRSFICDFSPHLRLPRVVHQQRATPSKSLNDGAVVGNHRGYGEVFAIFRVAVHQSGRCLLRWPSTAKTCIRVFPNSPIPSPDLRRNKRVFIAPSASGATLLFARQLNKSPTRKLN